MASVATGIQRTTGTPAGINIAARITALRATIQPGLQIRAADINELTTLTNLILGHVHSYFDQKQVATFGNNGDRVDYNSTKNTSTGSGFSGTVLPIFQGVTIYASYHNELANKSRQLTSHTHTFTDDTIL